MVANSTSRTSIVQATQCHVDVLCYICSVYSWPNSESLGENNTRGVEISFLKRVDEKKNFHSTMHLQINVN